MMKIYQKIETENENGRKQCIAPVDPAC